MQCSTGPTAGFTAGDPWLPVGSDPALTVEAQEHDDCSPLTLHRRLRVAPVRLGDHARGGRIVLSTMLDREDEAVGAIVDVRGDEGLIVRLP